MSEKLKSTFGWLFCLWRKYDESRKQTAKKEKKNYSFLSEKKTNRCDGGDWSDFNDLTDIL